MEYRFLPVQVMSGAAFSAGKAFGDNHLKYEYLPVAQDWSNWKSNERMTHLHWYDRNVESTYHPGALISYEYREGFGDLLKRYIGRAGIDPFDPDFLLMGDSGGFGVARRGANFDPIQVLLWQSTWCTRGFILDIPPYKYTGGAGAKGTAMEKWESSMKRTLHGLEMALPYYLEKREERPVFRWWGVVHGQTPEQLEDWYGRISAVYPFGDEGEGWSFAPKGGKRFINLATQLRFALSKGIDRVHFLQLAGWRDLGILLGLLYLDDEHEALAELTFDAASSAMAGTNQTFYTPRAQGPAFAWDSRRAWEFDWTCDCTACQWFMEDLNYSADQLQGFRCVEREDWRVSDDAKKWVGVYATIHNTLLMANQFARLFEEVQQDPRGVLAVCAENRMSDALQVWYEEARASSLRVRQGKFRSASEVFGDSK